MSEFKVEVTGVFGGISYRVVDRATGRVVGPYSRHRKVCEDWVRDSSGPVAPAPGVESCIFDDDGNLVGFTEI